MNWQAIHIQKLPFPDTYTNTQNYAADILKGRYYNVSGSSARKNGKFKWALILW